MASAVGSLLCPPPNRPSSPYSKRPGNIWSHLLPPLLLAGAAAAGQLQAWEGAAAHYFITLLSLTICFLGSGERRGAGAGAALWAPPACCAAVCGEPAGRTAQCRRPPRGGCMRRLAAVVHRAAPSSLRSLLLSLLLFFSHQ